VHLKEFLYHRVNFFDKFTQDYRQIPEGEEEEDDDENTLESEFGFDDLRGDVISIIMNYNITW
jgi:hypothetical protein